MRTALLAALTFTACNYTPRQVEPPATFTAAEALPPRPTDVSRPLDAVMWMLGYDVSRFDEVWQWLQQAVPAGPERERAIAAASLVALAELDRTDVRAEGLRAFDAAIAAFPEDDRLPLWRAYIGYLAARDAGDAAAVASALVEVRAATQAYPAFTLFGLTLAVGGFEGASPALLQEARDAFVTVVKETAALQHATTGVELDRSRRLWDSPIAPYNIVAMQAMVGDLALRAGEPDKATVAYYTALNANQAARWPWRPELERRLQHRDEVAQGFAARPATEWAFGSQGKSAMGMATAQRDSRFQGRVGNGSCTVCHTHLSLFDSGEAPAEVGWVKVKVHRPREVPNLQGVAFLLPDGKDPIPAGFGIGPFVDTTAPRDFTTQEALFDGTQVIAAKPGTYFVAVQATVDGKTWQGYLSRELSRQWFVEVKPGVMLDLSDSVIGMAPL